MNIAKQRDWLLLKDNYETLKVKKNLMVNNTPPDS